MEVKYSLEITNKFIEKYNDLDLLRNDPQYEKFIDEHFNEIENYRKIRNLLVHATYGQEKPFLVSNILLDNLDKLLKKVKLKAIDIGVKKSNIAFANLSSHIQSVIKVMVDNDYTNIPIIDNEDKIIGIINEKAIIRLIRDNKELKDPSTLVKQYFEYFKINNLVNNYYFVSKNELVEEIKEKYINHDKHSFGAILVTENGNKNEKLLSMFTSSDLI